VTSAAKSMVQAAEMQVLRLIKGVTRKNILRNEDIRAELQVKSILEFIEDSQLRWYGHMRRMTPVELHNVTCPRLHQLLP